MTDRSALREQYRDASNLRARVRLHQDFSTNPGDWHRWVFDRLELPDAGRVLEIGCGDGTLWRKNADRIPTTWAISLADFSPGMLDDTRSTLTPLARSFAYLGSDVQAIPFPDGHFDAVIANHMLYYPPDRPCAVAELRRVLRPGGNLYAATNGIAHMRELHALTDLYAPARYQWSFGDNFAETFTLENGAHQLRGSFANVALTRYDDALRVTDPTALVAYILSGRAGSVITDDNLAHLDAAIRQEIAARGAYNITKDVGLFVAR